MITASELDGIRRFLADGEAKNGLRIFCSKQVKEYTQECIGYVKSGETLKAAVEAGRQDAYESLLNQLEHFVNTTQV